MPTYVCSVKPNFLSTDQKRRIAEAIARDHSAVTGAPTALVHVIIEESDRTQRFVGGFPDEDHIWILGHVRAGRSSADIGRLMLAIARSVGEIAGLDVHLVWVYINEIASDHMVKHGSVHPAPGGETEWFDAMPAHVKGWIAAHTLT